MSERELLLLILKTVKGIAQLHGPYHKDHQMYDFVKEADGVLASELLGPSSGCDGGLIGERRAAAEGGQAADHLELVRDIALRRSQPKEMK